MSIKGTSRVKVPRLSALNIKIENYWVLKDFGKLYEVFEVSIIFLGFCVQFATLSEMNFVRHLNFFQDATKVRGSTGGTIIVAVRPRKSQKFVFCFPINIL